MTIKRKLRKDLERFVSNIDKNISDYEQEKINKRDFKTFVSINLNGYVLVRPFLEELEHSTNDLKKYDSEILNKINPYKELIPEQYLNELKYKDFGDK